MVDDLAPRLVITALFGISIALCLYVLVAQHGPRRCTLNNVLHVMMSVAMIVMAWSAGTKLPTTAPIVFFLLAAIWFVGVAVTGASGIGESLRNGYHAVMMTAMAWMFAAINGGLLASQPGHSHHHDVHASNMHTSSGTDASSMELSSKVNETAWITTINWIATLGFAVAAVYWLSRLLVARRTTPVSNGALVARRELLCQACMAAGAAIMFGAMV